MPLLDARAAEVGLAVVTLLALNNDAVAESTLECLYKTATTEETPALQQSTWVDSLQEVELQKQRSKDEQIEREDNEMGL